VTPEPLGSRRCSALRGALVGRRALDLPARRYAQRNLP